MENILRRILFHHILPTPILLESHIFFREHIKLEESVKIESLINKSLRLYVASNKFFFYLFSSFVCEIHFHIYTSSLPRAFNVSFRSIHLDLSIIAHNLIFYLLTSLLIFFFVDIAYFSSSI